MKSKRQERQTIFDEKGLIAFAEQLKKIRKEQGFSQEKLSDKSGVSLSQIARIETIKINPSLSTVFALARAMNIPLTDLFDFKLTK